VHHASPVIDIVLAAHAFRNPYSTDFNLQSSQIATFSITTISMVTCISGLKSENYLLRIHVVTIGKVLPIEEISALLAYNAAIWQNILATNTSLGR
jgi:hypothetical protein